MRLSETDSGTFLAISSTSSCIARTDTSAVSTATTTCRWRACATSDTVDSAGEPPSEGIGIMPDCITPEGIMPGGIMPSNPDCIDPCDAAAPCDDMAPCMGCTSAPPAGGHADAESCMDGHGGHTGGGAGCPSDGTPACIACCIACCIEPCMTPCMAP